MKEDLIKYRGQLKYLSEKYKTIVILIDSYINRIDDNTAEILEEGYNEFVKQRDKDLLKELEFFIKEVMK